MGAVPNGKGHDVGENASVAEKTPAEAADHPHRLEPAEGNLAESQGFLPNAEDMKTTQFTDFEGKTSFGMSVFNLGNAIMGSGILGLAYAMANTGIVLFLFLLTAVAGLSSYSIHLLLKSSGIVGIRAYEQLGFRAFGIPGKMAAAVAITLQNIGGKRRAFYLGVPLPNAYPRIQLWPESSPSNNCLSVSVCRVPFLSGYLGYTSGFSLSCMVFFLIAVIYKKFQVPCPFADFSYNGTAALNVSAAHSVEDEGPSPCNPRMVTLNSQTAYTIPILAFAFVCHPEVLPIYTELRNPSKRRMQHVSNISIAVMYIMYFLAALFGYLTFYGNVEAELLHTYSRIDPYDKLILCVRLAVLTAVTLTVPIVLFPVRRAIQQMLFPNKTFNWPRHICIAVVLLTLINLLVIFAPNILGIFGIIGATSAPCLIFIFPAIFYIRIVPKEDEPMRSVPKVLAACFAGLGFLFMIMSLSFIIIDWTTGSKNSGSGH
uniref:Solute carrier family 38 member 3a n=1 Tax=Scleropages formosus TaxID=113540 RepID=A0A8C9SAV0_SCLFO